MKALGMIEVYGYLAAIEALDSGLKAANVNLLDVTIVKGGLVTVLVTGDVGAVKAAMDASKTAVERIGKVVSVHVIARPSKEIETLLNPYSPNRPQSNIPVEYIAESETVREAVTEVVPDVVTDVVETVSDDNENGEIVLIEKEKKEIPSDITTLTPEMMQAMTVDRLRKLAREIRITNMTSKQIRFATKNDLIRSISEFKEQER